MKNHTFADLAAHEELFAPVFGDYAVPSDLREFDILPSDAAVRRHGGHEAPARRTTHSAHGSADTAHEELFAPVFGDYAVPSDLREFDTLPPDATIRRLGEDAFLRWLHYEMRGRTAPVRKSPVPLACEEPEEVVEYAPQKFVEATFHPDYPEAEDFKDGERDEDYRLAVHTARIQTLIALKKCNECPIAKTCLDLSVIHSPADGVWGVYGGMPEASRRLIANRFHKLRRAYNSTKTHEMSEEQRERYRARAAALTFE